jgi:nickel/cobalt transporter (NiCoT) family protein
MKLVKHIHILWNNSSRKTRQRMVILLSALVLFNLFVWMFGFIFARVHPILLGLIAIAYGLGLRHAVDADHIAAIDNTTRKLMSEGKKPIATGLFFSLGHSTIVFILSVLVAFSSLFIKHALPSLQSTGTIIGTSVSSFFLLLIGFINLIAFIDILRIFKCVTKGGSCKEKINDNHFHTTGFLSRLFKPVLRTVTSSWHMYFVGFLFGLGFDTASEVGLLSISAASSTTGISIGEMLLLPLAFTAGMVLIDTLDGILMLGAYGWAYVQPVRKLYYNLNITLVSVIVALFIGGVEAMQLLTSQFKFHNGFSQLINAIDLGKLGYITIVIFVISWLVSLFIYKIRRYDLIEESV